MPINQICSTFGGSQSNSVHAHIGESSRVSQGHG
jgi:hypothetical protein